MKRIPTNDRKEGWDLSDEGSQARRIEEEFDLALRIKRLPKRVRKIAVLIGEGYTYKEIGKKLGTTETNIQTIVYRHRLNL